MYCLLYSKFFNIERRGGCIGREETKASGFGFYSMVGDGSESMFTVYKASFSLPSLSTVSFDGKTIRDLTLNVKISPYTYTDAMGKEQQATYTILNSRINSDIWATVQDEIYIPDSEV